MRLEVDIRQGLFFGSPTVSAAVNAAGAMIGVATTLHVTSINDTLAGLAAAYLGDPALWREIARANGIDDPLDVQPGRTLVIPPRGRAAGGRAGGRTS